MKPALRSASGPWNNASSAFGDDACDSEIDHMPNDGRCYTYIFPCAWEDHCKIGFSRDPLDRITSLHRRWYDAFDVDRIVLLETDSVRESRDLELRLRRPLTAHNAPPPSTMRVEAAGLTEWFRGVSGALQSAVNSLATEGFRVHQGRAWMAVELSARSDTLFEWTLAQLSIDDLDAAIPTPDRPHVRDTLDAFTSLGIDLGNKLSPEVLAWYRR